jgi:hypothetical protein
MSFCSDVSSGRPSPSGGVGVDFFFHFQAVARGATRPPIA